MEKSKRPLTPKVRALVSPDRQSRRPVGRLTAPQIDALTAIATGVLIDAEASAQLAISALAEGAPDRAIPVLRIVLTDVSRSQSDKISAARALGSIGSAEAEAVILESFPQADARVQQELLGSLGKFGSKRVTTAFSWQSALDDPATQRQLDFARALISHRHGLDGPFLSLVSAAEPAPLDDDALAEVELRIKAPAATAVDRQRLVGSTYGIDLDVRSIGMRCGPTDWTLFLNSSLGPSLAELEPLFARPWLAGVLAQRYPGRERGSIRLVVLARPIDNEVRLEFARADGEVIYVGNVQRAGDRLEFAVSDVDRPGHVPTSVTGTIGPRDIVVTRSMTLATRSGVRDTLNVETRSGDHRADPKALPRRQGRLK